MKDTPASSATSSPSTRIVALGQRFAGDDGVALFVLDQLRAGLPKVGVGVELCVAAEPSQLLELLRGAQRVWLVDAVVGAGAPGGVHELRAEELCKRPACSVSSHGLDVAQTLELAQALWGRELAPEIRILAVSIDPPRRIAQGLSPAVAAAAEQCVERLKGLLRESAPAILLVLSLFQHGVE